MPARLSGQRKAATAPLEYGATHALPRPRRKGWRVVGLQEMILSEAVGEYSYTPRACKSSVIRRVGRRCGPATPSGLTGRNSPVLRMSARSVPICRLHSTSVHAACYAVTSPVSWRRPVLWVPQVTDDSHRVKMSLAAESPRRISRTDQEHGSGVSRCSRMGDIPGQFRPNGLCRVDEQRSCQDYRKGTQAGRARICGSRATRGVMMPQSV
jgi:hypothetical protein